MLSHTSHSNPLFNIDLEYFEEKVIQQNFLFPALKVAFGFDIVTESEPWLALWNDLIQNVDT